MKTFFTLLLLSNIAFAMVQWLFPYEQLMPRSKPSREAAENLMLLTEVQQPKARTLEPPDAAEDDATLADAAPVAEAPEAIEITGELCYTLGPFKTEQTAQEVTARFKQSAISITSRSSVEKEYQGIMVYIDGHNDRDAARKTADALKAKGIKDYIVFHDDNKSNALSLGVFGLKKNAEGLINKASRLGFQVKSEPRYRDRTIYWLDYSELEDTQLKSYIDLLKSSQGISRISRPCK